MSAEPTQRIGKPEIILWGLEKAKRAVLKDFGDYSPEDRLAALAAAEWFEREMGRWKQEAIREGE